MSNIALQGILYDAKSSHLKGTALAPPLIRESWHSEAFNYFAENGLEVSEAQLTDKGDFAIEQYEDIENVTARHLEEGFRVVTLGGDHSISYPLLKAYNRFYSDIHILHFDAHSDLYDELGGDRYSHACPFARVMEKQYASRLIQVGIRTLNIHQREQVKRFKVEVHEMKNGVPKTLALDKPVYISLDLDAFDPAFAPGVSHPEPGGLSARQVIDLIQQIRVPIIGADIVEYNPRQDFNGLTAVLASKLLKEIASKMIENSVSR